MSEHLMALTLTQLKSDPTEQFREWFALAEERSGLLHPDAAGLATIGLDGYPRGRIVLVRGVGERGLIFYTNTASEKGAELASIPKAALTFHWPNLTRQVRIHGDVELIDPAEADEYFAARPHGSQIGAWASEQSEVLESREVLLDRVKDFEERFAGGAVPRPPHWSGYRLIPQGYEFWQQGESRLHDRFRYTRGADGRWQIDRLHP